jgi:hypothetical protein
VIAKVAHYIQHAATYDLKYDPAMDEEDNVIVAFLDTYKRGVCRHYASAAALLFRTLGIPARYVVGFMVETKAGEFVDIVTPGHAWVEVYVDGIGWIQVEVTGAMEGSGGGSGGGFGDEPEIPVIEIIPTYQWKIYDAKPLEARSEIDANPVLAELLSRGFTYSVEVVGSQTDIGVGTSVITSFVLYDSSGRDVTDQYQIIRKDGVLEVLAPETKIIKVYLYELQKYYDGFTLWFGSDDYEIIEIPHGAKLNLYLNISMTDVGFLTLAEINGDISQYASYEVYENGKDVTDRYRVIFDKFAPSDTYIPIRVDQRNITVTTASQTKIDDGKPLENHNLHISAGSLIKGHYIAEAVVSGIQVGEGFSPNMLEQLLILDENGNDVTRFYNINAVLGTLTILPSAS